MILFLFFFYYCLNVYANYCSSKLPKNLEHYPCGSDCVFLDGICVDYCGNSNFYFVKDGRCIIEKCEEYNVKLRKKYVCSNDYIDDTLCKAHPKFKLKEIPFPVWVIPVFIGIVTLVAIISTVILVFCCKKKTSKTKKDRSKRNYDKLESGCYEKESYFLFQFKEPLSLSDVQKARFFFHGFTNLLNVLVGTKYFFYYFLI
jgi:hypothetical protein